MKTPRTIKIIRIMASVTAAVLKNERLAIKDGLSKLDDLGGVYVKFLQVLVLSLDVKDQELYQEMLSVYEQSQPDKLDVYSYLSKKGFQLDRFASIEQQPFATGSFGQIYKAQLHTGEVVIIKVLRPSVQKYLKYDLFIIKVLSKCYSLIDRQKVINFRQVYSQFKRVSLEETNYLREAQAVDYYYQKYKKHPRLVIPKMYFELSGPTVIVQDYIGGLSLAKLLAYKAEGHDARTFVREQLSSDLYLQLHTIGFELLSKALMGDLLQADPHPGNILLLPNDKVALIDFGMLTEVKENRGALYELLLQYQTYYSNNLLIDEFAVAALKYLAPELHAAIREAEKLLKTSKPGTNATLLDKLKRATADSVAQDYSVDLVQSMLEKKMIMKVLFFVINKGNRFGFNFDLSSVAFLKATQTYLNLCGRFEGDHGGVIVSSVINDTIAFAQQNLDKIIVSNDKQSAMEPLEALEILSTWFDKMARKDPWLMNAVAGGYIE